MKLTRRCQNCYQPYQPYEDEYGYKRCSVCDCVNGRLWDDEMHCIELEVARQAELGDLHVIRHFLEAVMHIGQYCRVQPHSKRSHDHGIGKIINIIGDQVCVKFRNNHVYFYDKDKVECIGKSTGKEH